MGLFKSIGTGAGVLVGSIIGGTVSLIGETVGSDFISEIGEGAYRVTAHTGEVLGSLGDGAFNCVSGAVTKDKEKAKEGFKEIVNTTTDYVVDMGHGIVEMTKIGAEGVKAVCTGDVDGAVETGKKIVKIAAISALSFSVLDAIDGSLDGHILDFDHDGVPDFLEKHGVIENPNTHHVTPHERHLADGRVIWVDGDGDTTVNTFRGWTQTNPNYRY